MASWKDNGPVIIPRELRRWSSHRGLLGGPLSILRMDRSRYEARFGAMQIAFDDGRGFVAGVMWTDSDGQKRRGTSPYRKRAGSTEVFDRYRERRAQIMKRDWLETDLPVVELDERFDVRAFVLYGSYVKGVRNLLCFAQMPKEQAQAMQRGQGYICLDPSDRLPLRTG